MGVMMGLMLSSVVYADEGWPDISEPTRGDVVLESGGDVALIISIEDYDQAQPIPGAVSNGRAWRSWFRDSLGAQTGGEVSDEHVFSVFKFYENKKTFDFLVVYQNREPLNGASGSAQ